MENGKVTSSSSFNITKIDDVEPTVTLDIPEQLVVGGNEYQLPSTYSVGLSGGTPICKIGDSGITNTKELTSGTYLIECSITNGAGVTKTVSKTVEVLEFIESDISTYDYTGDVQSFVAPTTGYYEVELWGASGGYSICDGRYCVQGGNGAYTRGIIHLNSQQELFVYVGQVGSNAIRGANAPASYNGGGLGTWDYSDNEAAGAGGGSTDIRLVSGDWNNFDSLKSRIIVAASGGGSAWYSNGGAGGGLNGYTNNPSAKAATQTTGYSFGQGQNGSGTGDSDGVGGAGSGYYGGYTSGAYGGSESGAGGSSFISGHNGCDAIAESSVSGSITHTGQAKHYSGYSFVDTVMIDGHGYKWTSTRGSVINQPTRDGTATQTGNVGNGYAKITALKLYTEEIEDIKASLDNVPNSILVGSDYSLPTSVTGKNVCKIGETEYSNTKDLGVGTYEIVCSVTSTGGNTKEIIKQLEVYDENTDITLEVPDRILVGSDYPLPTSVTGSSYSCKIGDTEYTNTKDLGVGTYEIVCGVTSIGGNTKEVTKQLEVYEEDTPTEEEDSNLEEGENNG